MTRHLLTILVLMGFSAALLAEDKPHPLALTECLRIAYEHNPDLAASQALVRQAEARVKESRSGYQPRIDFGGSYIRQTYNFAASPGTTPQQVELFYHGEGSATAPYYHAGVDLSQTIYDFGHTKGTVHRSEAQLLASREDLRRLHEVVGLNVRTAYFSVLAAKELGAIQAQSVKDQTRHLDQVQAFYEVGRRPKIDVTRQQVALANAQVDLRQAQADLEVAKAALATAMGLSIDQAPEPFNVLQQDEAYGTLPELMAEAERDRPDLRSMHDQLSAAQADVLIARSAFRPNIALSSVLDYRNLKFPLVYNWSVGSLIAQSLFTGGLNRARLLEAQAEEEGARANVASLLQKVRQDVFNSHSDLGVAQDKIGLALKAEQEAKENLELAEGRYGAGYGNIIELTDAQVLVTQSQAQVVSARYDYQIAAGRLYAAIGREADGTKP